MNKRIKNKWVKALRSGEYDQTDGTLAEVNLDTGKESFCCLGVLCDIHAQEKSGPGKGIGFAINNPHSSTTLVYYASRNKWDKEWGNLTDICA